MSSGGPQVFINSEAGFPTNGFNLLSMRELAHPVIQTKHNNAEISFMRKRYSSKLHASQAIPGEVLPLFKIADRFFTYETSNDFYSSVLCLRRPQ